MAGYLAKDVDEFIYIDIENQHPDSIRFIKDCEKALGKEIKILKSEYGNVDNVIKTFRFISSPYGAKCTEVLKKRVRKQWEYEHKDYDITYVWGFDLSEKHRADRTIESMPQFKHEFPLIEKCFQNKTATQCLSEWELKDQLCMTWAILTITVLAVLRAVWVIGTKSEWIFPKYFKNRQNWKER